MFISRLKQGFSYLFFRYDSKNDVEVKKILSDFEFDLFSKMSDYDKLHSFKLLEKVKKNNLLSGQKIYLKLALLHDCGKGKVGLLRRVKKVLFGDKILEKHCENAYELLKKHNLKLAELCKLHHNKDVDKFMKEFQSLDDE